MSGTFCPLSTCLPSGALACIHSGVPRFFSFLTLLITARCHSSVPPSSQRTSPFSPISSRDVSLRHRVAPWCSRRHRPLKSASMRSPAEVVAAGEELHYNWAPCNNNKMFFFSDFLAAVNHQHYRRHHHAIGSATLRTRCRTSPLELTRSILSPQLLSLHLFYSNFLPLSLFCDCFLTSSSSHLNPVIPHIYVPLQWTLWLRGRN